MQVVFGGLSVTIAIVALVIGYFAWVNPQSPDDDAGQTPRAQPATTTAGVSPATQPPAAGGKKVALASLTPSVGGANIRAAGGDLAMPCASGEATDRQRTVEYEIAGRYADFAATLTVSKASDQDSRLQLKILTDDRLAADVVLAKGKSAPANIALGGKRSMKIQLICESPDGEMTISAPFLTHV